MAVKKKDNNVFEQLAQEALISESYLTGIFFGNSELYSFYSEDQINSKTFLNPRIGFYFGLGRHLFSKGIVNFDDITVINAVQELGVQSKFDAYGAYEGIDEIVQEVIDKRDNLDGYYEEVKKYNLVNNLVGLFGNKVVESTDKYNYKKMTREQLQNYWLDKVNKLSMDGDNHFVEGNLLKGLRDDVQQWNENPSIGLEFYRSKLMTSATNGFEKGHVYINGGFSGFGKTSMSFNKVIMSHIVNNVKLLVIANEEDIEQFKKMLLITAMGNATHAGFQRKRINEGSFSDVELEKLNKALDWIEDVTGGDDSLVKFVFMDNYTIDSVKKIVTHYALRGYESLILDTAKPGDNLGNMQQWQRFMEDMKELHRLIKADTGLNIRAWCNVQLSDNAMNMRFLNYSALAAAKGIKNEASVVIMSRNVWADEYEGEKNELVCYKYMSREEADKEDPFNDTGEIEYINGKSYVMKKFKLKKTDSKGKKLQYSIMFFCKNRRGQSVETGLDPIVSLVDFNSNSWHELGYAMNVLRENSY